MRFLLLELLLHLLHHLEHSLTLLRLNPGYPSELLVSPVVLFLVAYCLLGLVQYDKARIDYMVLFGSIRFVLFDRFKRFQSRSGTTRHGSFIWFYLSGQVC